MKNLVNTTEINAVRYMNGFNAGKFRFITKCRAGFMTISEASEHANINYMEYPEMLMTAYKKGALQTIEFQPNGSDIWLTVFAKKGNKVVIIDEVIMKSLSVGTINQLWHNTNLYNQKQYEAVGAKTWASKAFVMNERVAEMA